MAKPKAHEPGESKESRAEYFRNYRATVKPMGERAAMKEGITRVVTYLREKVGGSAITGFQAALMVERAMLETESFSAATRQRFIENMRKT